MNIIQAFNDPNLLGKIYNPLDSWKPWMAFWKAVYAIPMDDQELEIFRACTKRKRPPSKPVSEAYGVIGAERESRAWVLLA